MSISIIGKGQITVTLVEDGDPGVGILQILEQYYLSTEDTEPIGGEWINSIPNWTQGTYVWRRQMIYYSDGRIEPNNPYLDSSWKAIENIKIGGSNLLNGTDYVNNILYWDNIKFINVENNKYYATTNININTLNQKIELRENISYTWSGYFRANVNNINIIAKINTQNVTIENLTTEWDYREITFISENNGIVNIDFITNADNVDTQFMKIEEGNKATSWVESIADSKYFAEQKSKEAENAANNLMTVTTNAMKDGLITETERQAIIEAQTTADTAKAKADANNQSIVELTNDVDDNLETFNRYVNDTDTHLANVDTKIINLEKQADGLIESFTGTEIPTLTNAPANAWVAAGEVELKKHEEDLYNLLEGDTIINTYKFLKLNEVYTWVLLSDSQAGAAQVLAQQALDLAGTKANIFYALDIGSILDYKKDDIWINPNTNSMYICLFDKSQSSSMNDWQLVNDSMYRISQMSKDLVISIEDKFNYRNIYNQILYEYARYEIDAAPENYNVDITNLRIAKENLINSFVNVYDILLVAGVTTDTIITQEQYDTHNELTSKYYSERTHFSNIISEKLIDDGIENIIIGGANYASENFNRNNSQTVSKFLDLSEHPEILNNTLIYKYYDTIENIRDIYIEYYNGDQRLGGSPTNTLSVTTPIINEPITRLLLVVRTNSPTVCPTKIKTVLQIGNKSTVWSKSFIDVENEYKTYSNNIAKTEADLAEGRANAITEQAKTDLDNAISALDLAKANADDVYDKTTSDNLINTAEQEAINAANLAIEAATGLADITVKAYADNIVTAEEARAIQDATDKANAAQAAAEAASKNLIDGIDVGKGNYARLKFNRNSNQVVTQSINLSDFPELLGKRVSYYYYDEIEGIKDVYAEWNNSGTYVGGSGSGTLGKTFILPSSGITGIVLVARTTSPDVIPTEVKVMFQIGNKPLKWEQSFRDREDEINNGLSSTDYLKEALLGKTISTTDGLALANILAVTNNTSSGEIATNVRGGVSGLIDDGIAFFAHDSLAYNIAAAYTNWLKNGGTEPTRPNFLVTDEGTLYAKNVDISGKITAISGNIGTWYLSNDILESRGSVSANLFSVLGKGYMSIIDKTISSDNNGSGIFINYKNTGIVGENNTFPDYVTTFSNYTVVVINDDTPNATSLSQSTALHINSKGRALSLNASKYALEIYNGDINIIGGGVGFTPNESISMPEHNNNWIGVQTPDGYKRFYFKKGILVNITNG